MEIGCVRLRSSASCFWIHPATQVLPVGRGLVVAIQGGNHDMDKENIAGLLVYLKTGNKMPSGVPVVTLASFADVYGTLDLQSQVLLGLRLFSDKVGVCLMRIVFEPSTVRKRIAQYVRYKATEVVALNVGLKNSSATGKEVGVDLANDPLCFVEGPFKSGVRH